MKGYNLTEVLISLALSTLVLGGLLQFSLRGVRDLAEVRREMRLRGSLEMGREELSLKARGLEPAFWEAFPVVNAVTGTCDHRHGAVAYRSPCRREPGTDCLTLWDIVPGSEEPALLEVVSGSLEETMTFANADLSDTRAASATLAPMSVLLFYANGRRFCALVSKVDLDEVELFPEPQQPWSWPPAPDLPTYDVVNLGLLVVTHCSLSPSPDQGGRLTYHEWQADAEGWQLGRAKTTYANIDILHWTRCDEQRADRIVLFGQAQEAPLLSEPLILEGLRFEREVTCASLEL